MQKKPARGFTLAEVTLSMLIMGLIAAAATGLLSAFTESYDRGIARAELHREGLVLMERITGKIKRATFVMIPNSFGPVRDTLALSGFFNDDNDYFFDDPLFPKYDEDLAPDMNEDGENGILGVDDDNDGWIDEDQSGWDWGENDDERNDGIDEDPVDGIDNDGDGNLDEDCGGDMNNDGAPGVRGIDDDNDGEVDEGSIYDDDEDDSTAEVGLIPMIYTWTSGTSTLTEACPYRNLSVDLSTRVTNFQVGYVGPHRITILLELTDANKETVEFREAVCPRNSYQKTGKRVK